MCLGNTRQSDWDCFDDFETAWHVQFQEANPNWSESIYCDGQLDDVPYYVWETLKP